MTTFSWYGYTVAVDEQATKDYYAKAPDWDCPCGQTGNTGKFCQNCGNPRPAPQPEGWDCSCGKTGNTGKFCNECGKPRPEGPAAT